jgi:Bacterial SH3 domain
MFSGILKFVLGISLALAVLIGSGVATALYFMNRVSMPAPKPVYPNDTPAVKAKAVKIQQVTSSPTPASQAKTEAKVGATPKPTQTETPEAAKEESLPPGSFNARVSWPKGLSLRSQPTLDAERIGGVGFNEKIIVLEESDGWQKVRLAQSKQEGWVRAGNTRKSEGEDDSQETQETQETQQQQ